MANLFKEKILKRKLENYEVPDFENKLEVVKKWHKVYENGSLKKKTESQCEQDFNQDFFIKVLDYTPYPNELYTIEPKSKSESKGGQTPDATLGFFNGAKNTQVVCEIKDVNTSLDKSQRREGNLSPVQQAFKYKPLFSTCNFVFATNFYDIRLYKDTLLDYEQWTLDHLVNPEDNYFNFKKFYYLLSSSNLIAKEGKSKTDGLISEIRIEQEQITKEFYKEYKGLRSELIENLKKNNPDKDIIFIIEKAQKIIDRIVFVHFCEDLDLLPEGKFLEVVNYAGQAFVDVWATMRGFFNAVDKGSDKLGIPDGYNGELFKPDPDLDYLIIDDEICKKFAELGKYDFSEDLSVNILGHIFEQSISDIEELKEEISDKKQSKRKKDGIFYTPDYIVDYIVKNSLGAYLQEKEEEILKSYNLINVKENLKDENYKKKMLSAYEEYRDKLTNVKVLDPACGSGAFLVKVFDYLFEENKRISSLIASYAGGAMSLFDTDSYIKDILQNNIYGVDLNPESVEITKLSLWLKTAQKGRKLIDLKGNIKCGNSLIDDEAVAGDKAFKWDKEFNEVMKSGGFDVVVGNPPYVNIYNILEKDRNFFNNSKNYLSTHLKYDIYILFIEKSLKLLKENGLISLIVPSVFLYVPYGRKIRKYIIDNTSILQLIDFTGFKIFEDAMVENCIFVFHKSIPSNNFTKALKPIENPNNNNYEIKLIPQFLFNKFENYQFRLEVNNINLEIVNKIQNDSIKLGAIYYISKGIVSYSKIDNRKKEDFLFKEKNKENYRKFLEGKDVSKYKINYKGLFLDYNIDIMSRPTFPELHENQKIIIRAIATGLISTLDSNSYFCDQKLIICSKRNIIEKYIPASKKGNIKKSSGIDFINDLYIISIINSKLFSFYYNKMLKGGISILPEDIRNLPIKKLNDKKQEPFIEKADKMLDLNKQFQEKLNKTISLIKSEYNIEKTPKKLEKFYELEFEEFKSALKVKKLSLTQKEELMDYFTSKKEELSKLKAEIDSTDKEIDNMVFDLYGLTDEERKIVLES